MTLYTWYYFFFICIYCTRTVFFSHRPWAVLPLFEMFAFLTLGCAAVSLCGAWILGSDFNMLIAFPKVFCCFDIVSRYRSFWICATGDAWCLHGLSSPTWRWSTMHMQRGNHHMSERMADQSWLGGFLPFEGTMYEHNSIAWDTTTFCLDEYAGPMQLKSKS